MKRGRKSPKGLVNGTDLAIATVLIIVAFILLFAWLLVITIVYYPDDGDKTTINNTTTVENNTYLTNVTGIVSQLYLSSGTLTNISSSINFPFDTVVSDPFSLYNISSSEWVVDRDGYWELSACIVFSQSNIIGFPTNLTYDHQIQAFVDGSFAPDASGFLFILTIPAYGIVTPPAIQQTICGSDTYFLNTGQSITIKIQTRIYPFFVTPSAVNGGEFSATRGTLKFIGQ